MEKNIGVCGCICSECEVYGVKCKGCHDIEGKACWLHEVGLDICDFYECSVINKELMHCGECTDIPCKKFLENKNPKLSEEEHRKIVKTRVVLLKKLAKNKN